MFFIYSGLDFVVTPSTMYEKTDDERTGDDSLSSTSRKKPRLNKIECSKDECDKLPNDSHTSGEYCKKESMNRLSWAIAFSDAEKVLTCRSFIIYLPIP